MLINDCGKCQEEVIAWHIFHRTQTLAKRLVADKVSS